ncbi:MAG: 4-hydroxythreonine-4-phosphate dehydrogenase PdxA [Desulfohalobiaceae bacterium]|nr:4-hydroxythreonine-4-phosphate dehydrogenase PdxA [Desulfohalobiaceae bacterium]
MVFGQHPLLVTLGDPNGLGPELACRFFGTAPPGDIPVVLLGPGEALELHRKRLGLSLFWEEIREEEMDPLSGGIYLFQPSGTEGLRITPGRPGPDGGRAAGRSLDAACRLLKAGLGAGLVTCPLDKATLKEAGYDFPGHTEYLAHSFGLESEDVCMHLASPQLRVSLVTTHLPLMRVPAALSRERILRCLRLTRDHLNRLGVSGPIAVCGLNPHAGEKGLLGGEEERIVQPAVVEAEEQGLEVSGPHPGDTVFYSALRGEFAAVLAMYHDQGLAPLKALYFGSSVNITLGLPQVRTSVDHGTGYDLVGSGRAGVRSLSAAVHMAVRLVQ